MIRTHEPKVPWVWVLLMASPVFADRMVGLISHSFQAFTLDKFTNDTGQMMFLGSFNLIFNLIVAPFVAWKSDRIWTRFGRRKPFLIVGWLGVALFVSLVPQMSSLFTVAICIIGFNFFMDFVTGGAFEPLFNEVVPQPQRGRAATIRKGLLLLAPLISNLTFMKAWDYNWNIHLGFTTLKISGEQLVYSSISMIVLTAMLLIAFFVKEVKPQKFPNLNERFSFKNYFGGIFRDRQQVKIYTLVFAMSALTFGLGGMLSTLMLTKQFGYSKEALGNLYAGLKVAQIILFLPLAGYLSDRVDRLKLFIGGIILSTMAPFCFWLWIHFVAPNNVPSLTTIICFTGFDIIVDFTVTIAMHPLVFDYIPRARMGTVYAGMGMVSAIAKLILMNLMGQFVKYYSIVFCEPGVVDYSSGYLCTSAVGFIGIFSALYFLRERRLGRVIPYGKLEHEAMAAARKAEAEQQAAAPEPVG